MFLHVKRKFCSQRGASLSMALMLFLVCVTVSSVVLAAGSAATGRISQIKQMEKSYCNVSSAAELFWDELNRSHSGAEVHIFRTCNAVDDSLVPTEDASFSYSVDGTDTPTTLFQKIACDVVFGTSSALAGTQHSVSQEQIKQSLMSESGVLAPKSLGVDSSSAANRNYGTLKVRSSDERLADVITNVTCEKNGDLTLTFKEEGAESYRTSITAKFDVDDQAPRITRKLDGSYRVEFETIISWDAESIKAGGVSS